MEHKIEILQYAVLQKLWKLLFQVVYKSSFLHVFFSNINLEKLTNVN
jgi:hypothetical protein